LVAPLALALLVAGCGQSDKDQVTAKVKEFVTAVAGKDYKTLCGDVLAPVLLADLKAGGIRCEQAMQISLAHVTAPSLAIGKVTVSGDSAQALTLSTAKGQAAALATIKLVKTGDGWRVSSLGSPIPGH
jgi:hypothetical protein